MGAAQSARNRLVSRRQADEETDESRRHYRAVLARINAMPRGAAVPFGPVVIEPPTKRGGHWWLLRAGADRHGHFGYSYPDLASLMREWSLAVTGFGKDSAGMFYTTEII